MDIISAIGKEAFDWLAGRFTKETTIMDMPEGLLERLASVDLTIRDYPSDPASITAIAVLTFAYKMAGKAQNPQDGPSDIALLKVLCKAELARRKGLEDLKNPYWRRPLFVILGGEVGDRIRGGNILAGGERR
jgi:hypothetical protein